MASLKIYVGTKLVFDHDWADITGRSVTNNRPQQNADDVTPYHGFTVQLLSQEKSIPFYVASQTDMDKITDDFQAGANRRDVVINLEEDLNQHLIHPDQG